ncbi:hypothetical protein SS50377_28307 [Spironucleus salmonicida]|uniref:Uncharacterized protein n=1 Tax=Spironucleus salmonicida TaxID=348837 RepID=V6LRA9_9EUKA|nr:hypothetical protein SS50377_28307 [Spironucleus salmonicida]|eukprot:EST46788.1 hypothetical protein SS50377_13188 [Spironucleus salmonicida]
MKINVPKQLENLPAAKELLSKRQSSRTTTPKPLQSSTKQSYTIPQIQDIPDAPKPPKMVQETFQSGDKLSSKAFDVGIAIKLIPVELAPYKKGENFVAVVNMVDQVLDTITDQRTDINSGSGFTQYWTDISDRKNLKWVPCDVLKKIDDDKFLVFISENNFNKVVSTSNIIFQDVVLLVDDENNVDEFGQYKTQTSLINIQQFISQYCQSNASQEYLIKIFNQQLQNTKLKAKFEQAIQDFGNLAIDITRQQFQQTDDFTEYAVVTLRQNRLHDMTIPANYSENQRAILVRNQADLRSKNAYHVPLNLANSLQQNLSAAVILCNQVIQGINFQQLNQNSIIFNFQDICDQVCSEFVQHAQLTDAQMQIMQKAYNDEQHQLHWCADFLVLFLWSSHKIFQVKKISQYCFGIDEPGADNLHIYDEHKKQFRKAQVKIEKHINNLFSKQFVTLQHYIATIFDQHKNDIMARATHFIDILWTGTLPEISVRVSESFIQHFSYKGIEQFFLRAKVRNNDYSILSFKDTFSEKLINTHKVIYQILSPHIVDQIISDFANSVLENLNFRLHNYQSSHGRSPSLEMRDKFAEESYQSTHSKYVQIFKIMEIQFFRIFINELYENALPEWFYFLLALIHGGNKKKSTSQIQPINLQSKSELTKILHLTPNEQSFMSSIQKDIDSLNKYSDFKIPINKEIASKTLECLSKWEFKALPEMTDNFVSGIKICPDPLSIAQNLESCISQLSMFYSSSPKFSDILIYNCKSGIVQNQLTLNERELFLDKQNLSYKAYLEVAYNNIPLQGGSQGNPFNLGFIKPDGKAANSHSKQKFITIVGNKVELNEQADEEFEFDIKIETKLAEAIYYEPSILLQKLVKLSKVSAEKVTKYFEIFVRYFTLHIQKSQIHIQFLNKKVDLMPEIVQKHSDYEYQVESISQNQKMVKITGTQEEQIKLKLKPFSDFLRNKGLVDLVIEEFQSGQAPPETCQMLINQQINKLLETMKIVYDNTFMILSLPNICYYSSFKISLTSLLQSLQIQDKILFDLYSNRLSDYFVLVLEICNNCLDKVNEKLNQTSFTSTQEIGEIYEICKLFTYNKDKWLELYGQMNDILEVYEEIPIGNISNTYYNIMHTQLIASQKKFKQVFTSQSLVTNRVSLAYQQCFTFLQNVQNWFDLLIIDVFGRTKEYFSICYTDWIQCSNQQQVFKQKYPLLTQSIIYPKPLKLDEFQLIDTKRLIKEIEQTSMLPIFKSNHIKIHIFERTILFKEENLNDAFQEAEEIINYSIQTLMLLNNLKLQLLGNTDIQFFDTIDKILFVTQAKKDSYIQQLKNKGDIVTLNKETLEVILSNNVNQTNSTQLSRLCSLQPVFQLASRLVFTCNNIQNSFSQWLDQALSMVNLEEIKRQLIEAIKVSTLVIVNFTQNIKIVTVALNLLQFLQDQHNIFYLIFLTKTAIYENNVSTIQHSSKEIVQRHKIDELLKIDSKDFSVSATLINIIIQSLNLKISDDVRTSDMLDVLKPYDDFIYLNTCHSLFKIRSDKLIAYQQTQINKIIAEGNLDSILETQFILPSMQSNETPKLKRDLNDFLILGPNNMKVKENYTVVYYKDYYNNQFFNQKIISTVRSNIIGCELENELLAFLNIQKTTIIESLFQNQITTYQAQQLINSSDSLNQMVSLHWQIYTYGGWVQLLNEVALELNQEGQPVNIQLNPLSQEQQEGFSQAIKQLRGLLTGCYTTASNAVQLSQRKFVRDKLWETVYQVYDIFRGQTKIQNAFYRIRKFYPKDLQITYLLDLMWYDSHSTPLLEKSKYAGKAAIVTQLTDDVNLTLCTLLTQLGFPDSMFNILYFLAKTEGGTPYGCYYIDGIIQSNATYFKFAYPLIYRSLRDIYINLTTPVLQKVVLATLETHMLYWQQKINSTYDFNIQQILISYPSNISFHICSQVIMHIFKNILSFNYKKDNQIQFLQHALQQFKVLYEQECNPEEKVYEFDINIALRQAQLSMLTSFENYLFFDLSSTLQSYPVGQQFQRQQNLNQQKKSNIVKQDTVQQEGLFDMLNDLDSDESQSDSELDDDLFGDSEAQSQDNKQRDFLHDGFNAEDFIILAMLRASQGIGPEQTQSIIYFISLLDSFLSSFQANSVWLDFVIPYCNKPLDQLVFALRKQINETKNSVYQNQKVEVVMKYQPKIDIFVNGGYIQQSHGFIKVASLYSPQILRITQMILQKYISKILEQMNIQTQVACITPVTDKYYYHLTYCLFIDIISNFLQRKVEHVHIISSYALDVISSLAATGVIILITGLELASLDILSKLQSIKVQAEKSGANFVYILPELVQTSTDQCVMTIQCKNTLQFSGLDVNGDNIFRFQELYFQQCEYELLYKKLSITNSLFIPQQIARFLFSSSQPIEQAVLQFCYIVAQQNKFQTSKLNQIVSTMKETMGSYLQSDFFDADINKKISSCDQFLYRFFDIQPEILFQNVENEIIVKEDLIVSKIPQQLSSFVYISQYLRQKTCLNSQGWKYVADIILLLFSARIDQIGLYFQQYNSIAVQQLLDCIFEISSNQIGIPVQVINGSQDFSFSSDNILQILPGMFYVIIYQNGSQDDFFEYKSMIQEFLVTPKPFDAIVLVISDCIDLLQLYCQYYQVVVENIISLRYLFNDFTSTMKFQQILSDDISVLDKKSLTQTEFDQIFTKFNISRQLRHIQQQSTKFIVVLFQELFDFCSQMFQITEIFAIRQVMANATILFQQYGFLDLRESLTAKSYLFQNYYYEISDEFLTQIVYSSGSNIGVAFGNITVFMFSIIFAGFQCYFVNVKDQDLSNEQIVQQMDSNYQLAYQCIQLYRMCPQMYVTVLNNALINFQIEYSDYINTISSSLPLPAQQKAQNSINFSNIYMVYLPLYQGMLNTSYQELHIFRGQLQLFSLGKLADTLLNQPKLIQSMLPFNNILNTTTEEKSDIFLTGANVNESRIQYFMRTFGEQFEYSNPQYRMVLFQSFSAIKLSIPQVLQSNKSSSNCEKILKGCIMQLNASLRSFSNMQNVNQNRHLLEYRYQSFVIADQMEISYFIQQIREFLTLLGNNAVMLFFTIIKFYVSMEIFESAWFQTLLTYQIQIPDQTGTIKHYRLLNCSFIIMFQQPQKLAKFNKKYKYPLFQCDFEKPQHKTDLNASQFHLNAHKFLFIKFGLDEDLLVDNINYLFTQQQQSTNEIQKVNQFYSTYQGSLKEELALFWDISAMINLIDVSQFKTLALKQLSHSFNVGLYQTYYNRVLFGCIRDAARGEYKESLQENYDKYKNDPNSLFEFNDGIIEEAQGYGCLLSLASSPVLEITIPTHFVKFQTLFSYQQIVQYISVITNSITDLPVEQDKIISKNMLIDVGDVSGIYQSYQQNYINSSILQLNTREKILSCIRTALNTTLHLQRGVVIPLSSKNKLENKKSYQSGLAAGLEQFKMQFTDDQMMFQQPVTQIQSQYGLFGQTAIDYVPTMSQQQFQITQPPQIQNFDAFRPALKKENYNYVILTFPLSILLSTNMLSVVLNLITPGNQGQQIFTSSEFQDMYQEAIVFSKLENLNFATVQLLMSQKLMIYIIQDVSYDLKNLPPFINYVNLQSYTNDIKIEQDNFIQLLEQNSNKDLIDTVKQRLLPDFISQSDELRHHQLALNLYSNLQQHNEQNFSVLFQLSQSIKQNLINKENSKHKILSDFQAKLIGVISVCKQAEKSLAQYQESQSNEKIVLDQLKQTQITLLKINNDLQSEFKAVLSSISLKQSELVQLQQQLDKQRKNQISMLSYTIIEMEQTSKSEIIDLYNSNITNNVMIFVFLVIWNIIFDKNTLFVSDLKYPTEQESAQQWKEIQQQMFVDIAIPHGIINFDYKQLTDTKIELIRKVCSMQELESELLSFTQTRLQRRLVNYVLALNIYFSNMIDPQQEIVITQLQQTIIELESKRTYLKEQEQFSIKAKILENQRQIDQFNQKYDQISDQVKIQSNSVNIASKIYSFFLQQQNDIVYDIQQVQMGINLIDFTSIGLAAYILYGGDMLKEILNILCPVIQNTCKFCQYNKDELCNSCYNCHCLCVCLNDLDDNGTVIKLNKQAPSYQTSEMIASRDKLYQLMNSLNQQTLLKKQTYDKLLAMGQVQLLELQQQIILRQAFPYKISIVSHIFYKQIISIIEQIPHLNNQYIVEFNDNYHQAMQIVENLVFSKEQAPYIVFNVTKSSPALIDIFIGLVQYNYAIKTGYTQIVNIGKERRKVNPQMTTINLYVIFQKLDDNYPLQYGFYNLFNYPQIYLSNQNLKFANELFTMDIQDNYYQQSMAVLKEQLSFIIWKYIHYQDITQYLSNVYDTKHQESQYYILIQNIVINCKNIGFDAPTTQFQNLQQHISNLEQSIQQKRTLTSQYQEFQAKFTKKIQQKDSWLNIYYKAFFSIQNMLVKLTPRFPMLIKSLNIDQIFKMSSDSLQYNTSILYQQILKNVIFIISNVLSLSDIEMVVFMIVVVIEKTFQRLPQEGYSLLLELIQCKFNKTQANIQEVFSKYPHAFIEEITTWMLSYKNDFDFAMKQQNIIEYVLSSQKTSIPQFIKDGTPVSGIYLFCLALIYSKQSLHDDIQIFLKLIFNYPYLFSDCQNMNAKQEIDFIQKQISRGPLIFQTLSFSRALQELLYLGKLHSYQFDHLYSLQNYSSVFVKPTIIRLYSFQFQEFSFQQALKYNTFQNVIFIIEVHPNLVNSQVLNVVYNMSYTLADFDSIHNYAAFKQQKIFFTFSNFITNNAQISQPLPSHPLFQQTQNNLYELYQILYISGFILAQEISSLNLHFAPIFEIIQALIARFQFLISINSVELEQVNDSVAQLLQFLAQQLPDSLNLIEISNSFNPISFIQQFSAIRLPLQAAMQFSYFRPFSDGIFTLVTAFLRNSSKFHAGKIQDSLKNFNNQKVTTTRISEFNTLMMMERIQKMDLFGNLQVVSQYTVECLQNKTFKGINIQQDVDFSVDSLFGEGVFLIASFQSFEGGKRAICGQQLVYVKITMEIPFEFSHTCYLSCFGVIFDCRSNEVMNNIIVCLE